jgi:glucose/arabinose dehydrogenase
MRENWLSRFIGALLVLGLFSSSACANTQSSMGLIKMPPGFSIEVFASAPGARSIAVSPELGVVFVGSKNESVFAISFKDGKSLSSWHLKGGLRVPHGVAWRDGYLYVGEQHRITRYRGDSLQALANAEPQTIYSNLTDSGWHGRRDLAFGPDGKLYVAVGTPCNICMPKGNHGTILRMDPDGSNATIFAKGIRNSVGLDFHPQTGELHFTDNGADRMGDDIPPEELNQAPVAGLHFGYPYYGGGDARTSEFKNATPPAGAVQPVVRFGAHVAPLGLHFYRGEQFPEEMRHDAFVAQHGSWNRSVPDGYRIARVRFDDKGQAQSWEPFVEGWLQEGTSWGRPADVNELPDGSLLISDDRQGVLYRVTYRQ